jgi:hypothetical protein
MLITKKHMSLFAGFSKWDNNQNSKLYLDWYTTQKGDQPWNNYRSITLSIGIIKLNFAVVFRWNY